MTRLQWNEQAFDLISGPPSSGQLAALRQAAEEVDRLINAGVRDACFSRVNRSYVVIASDGTKSFFPFNSL